MDFTHRKAPVFFEDLTLGKQYVMDFIFIGLFVLGGNKRIAESVGLLCSSCRSGNRLRVLTFRLDHADIEGQKRDLK